MDVALIRFAGLRSSCRPCMMSLNNNNNHAFMCSPFPDGAGPSQTFGGDQGRFGSFEMKWVLDHNVVEICIRTNCVLVIQGPRNFRKAMFQPFFLSTKTPLGRYVQLTHNFFALLSLMSSFLLC